LSSLRSSSRNSGVSSWPCEAVACFTAISMTSSSVPEILSEQFFSLGYSLQSINLRDCRVGLADMITFLLWFGIRYLKLHFFNALSRRQADSGRAEALTIFITSLVSRFTVSRRHAQP